MTLNERMFLSKEEELLVNLGDLEKLVRQLDNRIDTVKSIDISRFENPEMTKMMYLADLMAISSTLHLLVKKGLR